MAHVCPWWFAYTFDHPLRRLVHNPRRILAPYVRPGATVLDLGCGMGYFSLGMAQLVGDDGLVIAADLQPQMFPVIARRAGRLGVAHRIRTHPCEPGRIGLDGPIAFALAFWMMHEAPEPAAFMAEIHAHLTPGGAFLFTEPSFHVSREDFEATCALARAAGFAPGGEPRIRLSHAALFRRP